MDFDLPEELGMVRDTLREFVQNELVPIEQSVLVREKGGSWGAPIPREQYEHLKELAVEQGLWGMTVPEALGGGGLNTLGACLAAEELGKTFIPFDFGDLPPLLYDANAEQQQAFLAPMVAGEKECRLALREPESNGSTDLKALAQRNGQGWLLNGTKLADEGDVWLVFARAEEGVTCFIVEKDWPGVTFRDGMLALENVSVPAANVLGEIGGAYALGKKYASARWVQAAARKVGIAARLLEMSSQYARDWKALGQALAVRPAVQRDLAEMAVSIDAARWLVYRAACEIDAGHEATEDARRASLFASEMVERVIDRTVQLYGGPAFAADLPMLRIYRAELNQGSILQQVQRFQVANRLVNG